MLNEGLESCLQENEFSFVNELFIELETYSFEILNVENHNYRELTNKFCQINEPGKFILSENTKLSELLKRGIKNKFWILDRYDQSNKYVTDGDTIKIIPPSHTEYIPPPPESIEQSYINSENKYISCSKEYVTHVAMKVFYQRYETYKVAASMVKLCSMIEFFKEDDYKLSSIKHYILIHCICQKIIHENGYYKYFEK